jgi:Spy/CpxP family protein refolding chaperone
LRNSLSLTDEQAKTLEPFFKEQQAKMSALRTNTSLSRQERMATIKDMRRNSDEKMKAHLTPEQLQKMQQSRQGGMQFAPPNNPKEHPTAHAPESEVKSKPEPAAEHSDKPAAAPNLDKR